MKTNHQRSFKAKAYRTRVASMTVVATGVTTYMSPRGNESAYRSSPRKCGQYWGRTSELADVHVGASIGHDFSNGNRGMAKAVRGAKKYVRSRIRAKENVSTKRLVDELRRDD